MRTPAILLLTLALLSAGCTALGLGPQPAPGNAAELARLTYPKDAKFGDDLDVVALHRGDSLDLNNRTPRAYENVQVWLNQQYVLPVKKVAIGQDSMNHLDVGDFVNEHAEPFPVGGLLTPDRAMPLVIAEIFDPATGLKHHILVRNP